MAAPSFIAHHNTTDGWNDSNSPKTTASISVQTGDVLVAYALGESNAPAPFGVSGGGLTWTAQEALDTANRIGMNAWTTTATSTTSFTVSFTETTTGEWWGAAVDQFRGSDGVGAAESTNAADGAPSLNITTTQANSAIVVGIGDFEAADGATRAWRANAGALTETVYEFHTTHHTIYAGYHADAGAINTYAVGQTLLNSQDYTIFAIEVKGSASGGAAVTQRHLMLLGVGA